MMADNVFTQVCPHCKADREQIDRANAAIESLSGWAKDIGNYKPFAHRLCVPCNSSGIQLTAAGRGLLDVLMANIGTTQKAVDHVE